MNYYLHRISHESDVSYALFEAGYLSIGWSNCREEGRHLISIINDDGAFDKFMASKDPSRSRWGLWRFLRLQKGDFVVVPLRWGKFSVVEVLESAMPANEIFVSGVNLESKDIGFVIKIKKLTPALPRENAYPQLQRRMKIRQVNALINDLEEHIKNAVNATEEPIWAKLHDALSESVVVEMLKTFNTFITPDNLEHIVKWYMEKKGASDVSIPAKNERGKENGADSDVIADFEDLHIRIYIQVKKHDGETGKWAIEQIKEYAKQKNDLPSEDYTCCLWVITTAESFTSEAITMAHEEGVRLITGREFIKMLLDCGIGDITSAFDR